MNIFNNLFTTVGPIIIFLITGIIIRKKEILSPVQIEGIKILIVRFALPSALFLTFLNMELKPSLVALPGFAFFLCAATYIFGHIRYRRNPEINPAFPYLMSSFEFGMLGLILFTAAFGREHLGKLAITALGQEFFVWFIMIPHVSGISGKEHSRIIILKSFFTNPALIGIFTGLILNLSGYSHWKSDFTLFSMITSTLESMSAIIVPAVLIFIGYGMVINRAYIKETLGLIFQRSAVMIVPIILFIVFFINGTFKLDQYYSLGIITLFLLPPPFVIPLFLDEKRSTLLPRINSILIIYTVFSILAFSLLVLLVNP